jgi:hypothetical protein
MLIVRTKLLIGPYKEDLWAALRCKSSEPHRSMVRWGSSPCCGGRWRNRDGPLVGACARIHRDPPLFTDDLLAAFEDKSQAGGLSLEPFQLCAGFDEGGTQIGNAGFHLIGLEVQEIQLCLHGGAV